MGKYINYFLLINCINTVLNFVPLWNFEKSSFQITKETIITESKENKEEISYRLRKKFDRINKTIHNNYIEFYDSSNPNYIINSCKIDFDEINLALFRNYSYYVCPKGKNHLIYFNGTNKFERKLSPNNIYMRGNWELRCNLPPKHNSLFVSYMNRIGLLLQVDIDKAEITKMMNIKDGLFDYKSITESDDNKYNMIAFYLDREDLFLGELNVTIKDGKGFEIEQGNSKKILGESKTNIKAIFDSENDHFYFINYNNFSDLQTGYFEQFDKIDANNLQNIAAIINENSPLEFVEELNIEELRFLKNTKYAYYILSNKNNDIHYYGIIDVTLNKVIFNTDVKNISSFVPFSNNSMLVIQSDKAYKVCIISYNLDCIDKCPEGKVLVYDTEGNTCKEVMNCPSYILKPNDICIESCDPSIYTSNDKKECGLCKDLELDKPYKLINDINSTCLASKPEGTEYVNEKSKLLRCANGYKYENGSCISMNCYSLCDTCSVSSVDENDQKCLTCKNDFFLANGNCYKVCPLGYFSSGKICEKCNDLCKSCNKRPDNCLTCSLGFYFNDENCLPCHNNCGSCLKGGNNNDENCLTCRDNFYLIEADGFGKNCVSECPENTALDESKSKCIYSEKNNNLIIDVTIIILIIILIIIISFMAFYCIRRYIKRKNARKRMIAHINETDLLILD